MGKPTGGHTPVPRAEFIGAVEGTGGTETSKYPEEKKSNEIPSVVASESGRCPNHPGLVAGRPMPGGVVRA